MTDTLIALISIFIGLFGSNLLAILKNKYTIGFTGNTISGVFGSIFFIKLFGRLGFGPRSIMESGEVNSLLFTINVVVSFIGGAIGLLVINLIINKLNKAKNKN